VSVDLLYTDVEDDLRASVRALVADRSPWPRVLARVETDEPYDAKLWRALAADLGCAGLAVPAERGGAGASLREAAVVCEELGRGVAPVPYLGSAVVATTALLACADDELLAAVAAGSRTAALAVPFSTPPGAYPTGVRADGDTVTGAVTSVADALPADVLLVATPDGLYAVDAGAPGVTRTPVASLDLTRQLVDLSFRQAPARRLADGDTARDAVTAALTAGAALLASEQLGLAEWCLQATVEYARSRHQFGRPIGSFQALKHRLADVWVDVAQARAAARYAAVCVAGADPDAPVATALAKAHCSAVAVKAAEECVQLHGGIGFTWEHPAHLYLKRAKADALAFGTADRHRAALAALVDLAPAGG
jgi:alkylation response protein AidB-like acyl-CoA dehydrogenase